MTSTTEYKSGQIIMTLKDMFGEIDIANKTMATFQKASPVNQTLRGVEIGVAKYSMLFLVNVRVQSNFIFFDTVFDNKAITFKCNNTEEISKSFMIVRLPNTDGLDVVDRWCTDHMGLRGGTVTGQIFLTRSNFSYFTVSAIKGKYDDLRWPWGGYNFETTYLDKNKPYIGVAIRRKSSTRSFFLQIMDDNGQHYCKEFRASKQKKYMDQALSEYFVQISPISRIPAPPNYWTKR